MRPESAAFLAKAGEFLLKAEDFFRSGWYDEAGRAAYLAGFHAAQAVILEKAGKRAKTHRGVQSELLRLIAEEPGFDPELAAFLGRAYTLKAMADYQTGAGAQVPVERARWAVATAGRFAAAVSGMLE